MRETSVLSWIWWLSDLRDSCFCLLPERKRKKLRGQGKVISLLLTVGKENELRDHIFTLKVSFFVPIFVGMNTVLLNIAQYYP